MAKKKEKVRPIDEPVKPKVIQITSVKRTRKTIEIGWTQAESAFKLCERDNPLPSFITALDALAGVVEAVLHLPTSDNLTVTGFKLGEQAGATNVSFNSSVILDDADKPWKFSTPFRLLAHPVEPGVYTPPLCDAHKLIVEEAVEQARLYIIGDRAQGQIELPEDGAGADEDSEDDKDDGEQLPL